MEFMSEKFPSQSKTFSSLSSKNVRIYVKYSMVWNNVEKCHLYQEKNVKKFWGNFGAKVQDDLLTYRA